METIDLTSKSIALILLAGFCLTGECVAADIHVWTDQEGHRNISTVPPQGFNRQGKLRRQYDPNSILFQHHEMQRALKAQALSLQEENEIGVEPIEPQAKALGTIRAPKEGIMGLRELIQLERRGGRYLDQ